MSVRRRAILHIGTEKTGTTSVQHLLDANRIALRDSGVLFPKSAGPVNHTRIVAASLDDGVVDNIKAHIMAARREDERALRSNFSKHLKREMTDGPDWHTLLLSSELIHSRLHTPTEIARLFSYFEDFVDEVHVIAVLRRQDKVAVSRFSTVIRAGHQGFDDVFGDLHKHAYIALPPGRQISDFDHYYDYAALLDRFSGQVPAANIHVWAYEKHGRKLDTPAQLAALLTTPLTVANKASRLNPAMSLSAQHVIATLNSEIRSHLPSGLRNSDFIDLKRQIETELTGCVRQVARADAAAFLDRFTQSNAVVAGRVSSEPLFDSDFDHYPEIAKNVLPDNTAELLSHYRALMPAPEHPSLLKRLKLLLKI